MYLPVSWQTFVDDMTVWVADLPWGGDYILSQSLMVFWVSGVVLALTPTGQRAGRALRIFVGLALFSSLLSFGVPAIRLLMMLQLGNTGEQIGILVQWCLLFAGFYVLIALLGYGPGRLIGAVLRPGLKKSPRRRRLFLED
ncbi:hypothetical protein PQU92_05400 [Asticcacaulis sp. BYS171W]|uniref:Uncharacterized protein n=1 Tax=Asticcacaulis aquaticus TaxID=2984212 RepID=A0ABT5HT96_9CAUL|nr:hypothetical protein [Asticcacaulis aquaticus]MDC7682701.1 hypothetical protein [Asticcacaulis aquaticus]